MKNLFLMLTLTFLSATAQAQNCGSPSSLEDMIECGLEGDLTRSLNNPGATYCDLHDCTTGELLTETRNRNNARLPGLTALFSSRGADCTNFIKSDGTYGAWGEVVRTAISNERVSARFLNTNIPSIADACPLWSSLNNEQRTHFWVWVFASIAWDEATCKASARNTNATNGVAVGLMQLDEGRSARRWRGPNCNVSSVADATNNLKCGVDIMAELLLGPRGEYKGRGALLNNSGRNTSYWQKLRTRGGGAIGERIKSYPLCQR